MKSEKPEMTIATENDHYDIYESLIKSIDFENEYSISDNISREFFYNESMC